MTATREQRFIPSVAECRDVDGKKTFTGKAVVYRSWSLPICGMFIEQIAPGAFRDNLATNPDVVCTVDHDFKRMIGRTTSGTLRLSDADDALTAECDRSELTAARDLALQIERRDVVGMSFIFDCIDDEWGYDEEKGMRTRTVKKARLYEVTFATFPAYPDTEAQMRDLKNIVPPDPREMDRAKLALEAAAADD